MQIQTRGSNPDRDRTVGPDQSQQFGQDIALDGDAALGGGEIRPGDVQENGAAAPGNRRIGIVADHDDEVVQPVLAPHPFMPRAAGQRYRAGVQNSGPINRIGWQPDLSAPIDTKGISGAVANRRERAPPGRKRKAGPAGTGTSSNEISKGNSYLCTAQAAPRQPFDRDRLVRMCEMFGSPAHRARRAAFQWANRIVREAGLKWADIIRVDLDLDADAVYTYDRRRLMQGKCFRRAGGQA